MLQQQIEQLRQRLREDAAWMLAPNGQPSLLSEQQWLMARTRAFKAWFGDWQKGKPGKNCSVLLDSQGEPRVFFHGAGCDFDRFDYAFTNQGNDEMGSGFYFTTDRTEAMRYTAAQLNGMPKPGGEKTPTVHEVFLNIRNPLPREKEGSISRAKADAMLRASPVLTDALSDWGDIEHEGFERVFAEAVPAYVLRNHLIIKALFEIANDFYPGSEHIRAFNSQAQKVLGFDAVTDAFLVNGKKMHVAAWFPEQICSATHLPRAESTLLTAPEREDAQSLSM